MTYAFLFRVTKDKANQSAFANTLLGYVIGRNDGKRNRNQQLDCHVMFSDDGKNHFWLLRKKE